MGLIILIVYVILCFHKELRAVCGNAHRSLAKYFHVYEDDTKRLNVQGISDEN